jgi:hypothetical protein
MGIDQELIDLACERAARIAPVREPGQIDFDERDRQRTAAVLYQWYTEGLRLIRPSPTQEAFLSCKKKLRVAEGSNRSLKSTAGAIECARCVTHQDPHNKFPARGLGLVVALDWQPHVSELWRKMTVEGEFKVIPDEHTGLPRAVRSDPKNPTQLDPYDAAYRERWSDGAPLIPPRWIKRVNFESMSPPTPRWALIEGPGFRWELDFRSSKGTPVHGKHYNFAWFDEQLMNEQFFYEAMRGLVAIHEPPEHTPRFWWTATSQITNPQYFELSEKAEKGSSSVETFRFLIKDNPYISAEEKQAFHDALPPDERASRYYGEHALVAARIYPGFDPMGAHGCEPFEIPPTWARYGVVDPGRQYYATLFAAVPPDERHVYIYDGFVIKNAGREAWAGEVKRRQHTVQFEAFVIDQQAGRQHPMGAEDHEGVARQFWQAMTKQGVVPNQVATGKWAGFFPGSKDIRAREEALKGWLAIRGEGHVAGTAKLQIFRGQFPELEKQIRYACMKRDDPSKREIREESWVQCLEYLADFNPGYHSPNPVTKINEKSAVMADWEDQKRYERRRTLAASMLETFH